METRRSSRKQRTADNISAYSSARRRSQRQSQSTKSKSKRDERTFDNSKTQHQQQLSGGVGGNNQIVSKGKRKAGSFSGNTNQEERGTHRKRTRLDSGAKGSADRKEKQPFSPSSSHKFRYRVSPKHNSGSPFRQQQACNSQKNKEKTRSKMEEDRDNGDMHRDKDGSGPSGNARGFSHDFGSGLSRFSDTALQGLLKKLGAGFEDLLPHSFDHSQLRNILNGLKAYEDETRQLEALNNLCEILSVSSEDTLSTFSVDSFVPLLVNLLNVEHNPDIALLAARALTNLADVLPASCSSIVHHGAVPVLCGKLLAVEYIDLAEQSLQALEKISAENGYACLQAGGITAVLSFLDFFQTGVQRVAVKTASNICRAIRPESLDLIKDNIPILKNLLQYSDNKIVEYAFLSLARICGGICRNPEHVEVILSNQILDEIARLAQISEAGSLNSSLTLSTYFEVVKVLTTCASSSPKIAERLLELDIPQSMQRILSSSYLVLSSPASPSSFLRSPENANKILKLVDSLMPPFPDVSRLEAHEISKLILDTGSISSSSTSSSAYFKEVLRKKPLLFSKTASSLLPTLLAMINSTLTTQLKYICLSSTKKLLLFSTAESLKQTLKELPISSMIVNLLSSEDYGVALDGVIMSEILMEKLPQIFTTYFMKEGVVYNINSLAATALPKEAVKSDVGSDRRKRSGSKKYPHDNDGSYCTPQSRLKITAVKHAQLFQSKYLNGNEHGPSSTTMTKEIEELSNLARNIGNGDERALKVILEKIADKENGLSSFELAHCGLEKALLKFLVDGSNGKNPTDRIQSFLSAFTSIKDPKSTFTSLLKRLHEIISGKEKFNVMTCPTPTIRYLFSDRMSKDSSLAALAHPFKLRLTRADDEKELRDYSANVVLVEPLSTFETIEDFLWMRVANNVRGSFNNGGGQRPVDKLNRQKPTRRDSKRDEDKIVTRSMKAKAREGESSMAQEDKGEDDIGRKDVRSNQWDALETDDHPDSEHLDTEDDEEMHSDDEEMHSDEDEDDDEEDNDVDNDIVEDEIDEEDSFENPFRSRRESEVNEIDLESEKVDNASTSSANKTKQMRYVDKASKKIERLQFVLNGKVLNSSSTVFQAILLQANTALVSADEPQGQGHSSRGSSYHVWEKVHTLVYRQVSGSGSEKENSNSEKMEALVSDVLPPEELVEKKFCSDVALSDDMSKDLGETLMLVDTLSWLHANQERAFSDNSDFAFLKSVPEEDFVSPKLASKVRRQLQDVLVVCGSAIPEWLHKLICKHPFVFPFELRCLYLHSTSLGVAHAINYLLQQTPNGESLRNDLRDIRIMRNKRQKVRINRHKLFESALRVMELYAKSKATLEVEYFDEVGTGLGPTLEFYTLLSSELQKRCRNMWLTKTCNESHVNGRKAVKRIERADSADHQPDSELIFGDMENVPNLSPPSRRVSFKDEQVVQDLVEPLGDGLYPKPSKDVDKHTIECFRLLGRATGKALHDGRLLDLSLSSVFWRRALGKRLTIYDLQSVDTDLSKTMIKLYNVSKSTGPKTMDGVEIEDLGLYFTMPGDDQYELCENGSEKAVTGDNLSYFVQCILDAYFGAGTDKQFVAFQEGFEEVFDFKKLNIFAPHEFDVLIGGQLEKWTVDMLSECLKFDHGYTESSPYIQQFLHILAEFTPDEQRQFLKFVTGAPRLPPGGLSALNPKLTIVRKNFSAARDSTSNTPQSASVHTPGSELTLENSDLPSVMTCANYLKLPPYGSKKLMREKLLYAMEEGLNSFNLS